MERNTKDIWDILSAITPLIIGLAVTGIVAIFTQIYNFRQLQLNQIQALDRFRPLLTSSQPEEREFGYAAFVALGYEQIALKIIDINKDVSGKAVAEALASSQNKEIRQAAEKVLSEADKLINRFEFGEEDPSLTDQEKQIMQRAEQRAEQMAKEYGIVTKLGMAILQDTMTQHGPFSTNKFAEEATKALSGSPNSGASEKDWLLQFLEIRKQRYRNSQFRRLIEIRANTFMDLVEKEDWNMESVK
jgi:predicted GNAT family acetyltransferase